MEYVRFGSTGMKVSRFCIGGMMFGRKLDADDTARVVDEAIDNGVNFFDTAESYGDSEELLGKSLKGKRDDVFLATKVFKQRARNGQTGRNARENIIHSVERSLRLLQTDTIDLYQLHHPDPETPLEETMATLDGLVRQGKIRHVGVTNHYAWQVAYMIARSQVRGWDPVVSVQCQHNILDREVENETVPFAERFGLAMMCYGPLSGGVLTGKYKRGEIPPEDARGAKVKKIHRRYLQHDSVHEVLDVVREVAQKHDLQPAQVAMLWLMAKPYVTTPILGGSKPEHFSLMYEIADRSLPEEDIERIDEVSQGQRYQPYFNQPQAAGAPLPANW